MDSSVVITVATGVGISLGLALHNRSRRQRDRELAELIEKALQQRDPLVLRELSAILSLDGFSGRGKVADALNELVSSGKVEMIPAPEGTPQLQKVHHIKYRWRT